MCGMGAWGVQSQQFSIYFIEHSFFYCFLSNVRRSNNNNMRGMQCDPVLILIFFPLSFFVFWSIGVENITEPLCAECSFQGGMSRERGTVERGGVFRTCRRPSGRHFPHFPHTWHDQTWAWDVIEQVTNYKIRRQIHTYIVHLCICQIHGQLSLDIASAVPPTPPPPFTRLNATYDRNISKWISK